MITGGPVKNKITATIGTTTENLSDYSVRNYNILSIAKCWLESFCDN